jgi:hypothetical protein
VFLLVCLGGLLLSLSAAPGCCRRYIGSKEKAAATERPGVTMTGEVPHSKESISEIRDRESTHPLPARGDTAIHSHKIPRTGNDNGTSILPGGDNTVK